MSEIKKDRQESCRTCYFFEQTEDDDFGAEINAEYGVCRRCPPKFSDAMLYTLGIYQRDNDHRRCQDGLTWESMSDQRHDHTNFFWPTVKFSDWCGEYRTTKGNQCND